MMHEASIILRRLYAQIKDIILLTHTGTVQDGGNTIVNLKVMFLRGLK